MLLPKGVPLYQCLNTTFTNLRGLLHTLKEGKFYGYVEVQFPGYKGILLCDAGDVVIASEEVDGEIRTGHDAITSVLARAGERGGEVNVIQISPDLVYHCASQYNSQPVHTDLSTEFTRLDKLLTDLKRQRHTGHVEVFFRTGGTGVIFFDEGEPAQSLCGSPDEATITDTAAIQRIMERAEQGGATISVFRATGAPILRTDPGAVAAGTGRERPDLFAAVQGILREVEAVVDGLAGSGTFGMAFRRALNERSEQYPFLDPFEGLFGYKDGQVTFRGNEAPEVVIPAVRDCLVQTLRILTSNPARDSKGLRSRLQTVLTTLAKDLPAELQAWGFDTALLRPGE